MARVTRSSVTRSMKKTSVASARVARTATAVTTTTPRARQTASAKAKPPNNTTSSLVKSPGTPPPSTLSNKKYSQWSRHAAASPFPNFPYPTPEECQTAHSILLDMHGAQVEANFNEADGPVDDWKYDRVMDALVVAALSQATSWANAKRAMASMKVVYGSPFAYDLIEQGGVEKLQNALRPGGMQNRKAKILLTLLRDVKARHGKWDLQYLFDVSDEEAVKEVVGYWGIGPKCAHCLLSICLKRDRFAVDVHCYRLAGRWGWLPKGADVKSAQAHLDARLPDGIKFALHYEMIVHGRECACCRGNGHGDLRACEFWTRYKKALAAGKSVKGEKLVREEQDEKEEKE
ncbi:base excision DNA repair protein [Plectosphaerella plurivora]|uniref:Base excision DNA repair protein n=1 Tax=Plectosphaerella plurivora TaxID=936078 RepID=A0A9P8VJC7_9PEZI|nr:base excision DNA repair protein [Plectosphaerella plurivora]